MNQTNLEMATENVSTASESTNASGGLNIILEPEFAVFNKIRTVMCRNSPCTRGNRCTFAHSASELRRSLCMYHFNNGCTKSAKICIHSHDDKDLEKSIIDYKKWKNPSPKPQPHKISEEEMLKTIEEFKISLEDDKSDDEDLGEYEDETDKKMAKVVKQCAKQPYQLLTTTDCSAFNPSSEYLQIPGIQPLVPLESWEVGDPDQTEKTNTSSATEECSSMDSTSAGSSSIYQIIYNQQIMINMMLTQIHNLEVKVGELTQKVSQNELPFIDLNNK